MIKNISGFEWAWQIALAFSSDVAGNFVKYAWEKIKATKVSPSGFFKFDDTNEGKEFWMDVTEKVLSNVWSSIDEVLEAVGGRMKKDMKWATKKLSPAEAVEKVIFACILMAINEGWLDRVFLWIAARVASGMSPLEAMGLTGLQWKQSTSEEAMKKLSIIDALTHPHTHEDEVEEADVEEDDCDGCDGCEGESQSTLNEEVLKQVIDAIINNRK